MALARTAVAGLLAGVTFVGAAWAGIAAAPTDETSVTATARPAPAGLLVGASRSSIAPRPDDYGGTWETDIDRCRTLDPGYLEQLGIHPEDGAHLASTGSPWPENPNCIYMGGFGIGPMNPVSSFDEELGLWVRSLAIGDGDDTVVLTIVDGEGWLWDYATRCEPCGARELGEELGAELDIDPAGIVIAATHSHAAPDFIGGWGFVPTWYLEQVTDTIRQTVRDAVAAMEPAVVEVGEVQARPYNSERRDTYRSAEEQQAGWLRAYVPARGNQAPRVIATLGAYAAHPTTHGTNDGVAHADWVGEFEHELEERFGGIGLHFMTGLGNMSSSNDTGQSLADLLPPVGAGTPIADPDVRAVRETWRQPATNVPLSALGAPGFFDRQFDPIPASVSVGESEAAPCASASPVSLEVAAGAIRIGDELAITTGPGELFANLTNTIKEQSPAPFTLPLAQANDALGYLPQSFEMSPIGQQGLGFVAGGVLIVNYEDSYAIDRCFGDMVLETTLGLLNPD